MLAVFFSAKAIKNMTSQLSKSFFFMISLNWAYAQAEPSFPLVSNIAAVWNLSAQPCNGDLGSVMDRSPEQAKIQKEKVLSFPSTGFNIRVFQHPDITNSYLKIFLSDRSRGVVDNYFLISSEDLSPPVAAIVLTELPSQFDNSDKVFSAVETLEGRLSGDVPKFEKIKGPYGDALQMITLNRLSSQCFPTAKFLIGSDPEDRTIGISRFVFTQGKLVEFSLILRLKREISDESARVYASHIMDGFWKSFFLKH